MNGERCVVCVFSKLRINHTLPTVPRNVTGNHVERIGDSRDFAHKLCTVFPQLFPKFALGFWALGVTLGIEMLLYFAQCGSDIGIGM